MQVGIVCVVVAVVSMMLVAVVVATVASVSTLTVSMMETVTVVTGDVVVVTVLVVVVGIVEVVVTVVVRGVSMQEQNVLMNDAACVSKYENRELAGLPANGAERGYVVIVPPEVAITLAVSLFSLLALS